MAGELQRAAAYYVLGYMFVDQDLPSIAIDALSRGVESHSLLLLAGATPADETDELRALFEDSLRELQVPLPSRVEAAELLKCEFARAVLEGVWSPRVGARQIVELYYDIESEVPDERYAADGFGVANLLGTFYSFDDIRADDLMTERNSKRRCATTVPESLHLGETTLPNTPLLLTSARHGDC